MNILFLGDIVGKPARTFLKERLKGVRDELKIDFVVANGENCAGGSSVTLSTAQDIFNAGVDVITSGDHIFKKKDAQAVLETMDVIRPLNYGELAWGRGYLVKEINNTKVAVVNLLGRVFMQPAECPFKAVKEALKDIEASVIIVDVHAEATSEKIALGYFLAGKVSGVVGTHTHIPTADERIIDGKTAYITDVGMVGSCDSVLGRDKHQIIEKFVTNMPVRFNLASADIRMQGVFIEVDATTGEAHSIKRIEYAQEQ